jgi:hypothetical protein
MRDDAAVFIFPTEHLELYQVDKPQSNREISSTENSLTMVRDCYYQVEVKWS